jgi:hypothetical protein
LCQCAGDPEYDSPYIAAARKNGYDLPFWEKLMAIRWEDGRLKLGRLKGGKIDDITVIVARVTETPPPERSVGAVPDQSGSADGDGASMTATAPGEGAASGGSGEAQAEAGAMEAGAVEAGAGEVRANGAIASTISAEGEDSLPDGAPSVSSRAGPSADVPPVVGVASARPPVVDVAPSHRNRQAEQGAEPAVSVDAATGEVATGEAVTVTRGSEVYARARTESHVSA